MTVPSWNDEGVFSQGKIITHMLRNQPALARDLLRGWATHDLTSLRNACSALVSMLDREIDRRP